MTKLHDIVKPNADMDKIMGRLLERILISDPEHHWLYKKTHNGDGEFFLRKRELCPQYRRHEGFGRRVSARRLIYLIYHGEIPDGKYVKSVCKTWPPCLNPWHMKLINREVKGDD